MILAGDIGGTKTVLAVYDESTGKLEHVLQKKYKSREFPVFEDVLSLFIQNINLKQIRAACLGVAGPVVNGRCKTTNLPWVLNEKDLARLLGIKSVRLLNDLQAMAYGMLFLAERELATLSRGRPPKGKGNIAVIAAGTGLGEAVLIWNGRDYIPVPSEGGHTDFAPANSRQIDLLRFLQPRYGHVSYERLLSGPGLLNIYQFLSQTGLYREPKALREKVKSGDPGTVITRLGLQQSHPLYVHALDLFTEIYGAEAGNLALKAYATGGVYIGGGIAPNILRKLSDGVFMKAFWNKGRYSAFLKHIPVKVTLNPHTALQGAAHYAHGL